LVCTRHGPTRALRCQRPASSQMRYDAPETPVDRTHTHSMKNSRADTAHHTPLLIHARSTEIVKCAPLALIVVVTLPRRRVSQRTSNDVTVTSQFQSRSDLDRVSLGRLTRYIWLPATAVAGPLGRRQSRARRRGLLHLPVKRRRGTRWTAARPWTAGVAGVFLI